jgi:NitT/TauT family transport system substrate-binding protein
MRNRSAPRRAGMVMTAAALAVALTGLAGCGGGGSTSAGSSTEPVTLRLGHFPNLTHATAIVGIAKGIFKANLRSNVTFETKQYNAGPAAVAALFAGAIDATFIGPNPSINAFSQSKGEAVRIVAGAASGGVFFVVKPGITKPEDLTGKTIATPQLGNTQDVALRFWLKQKGYTTTKEGGGDVKIKPQDNAVTVDDFKAGRIDGAWVPEPTASRLIGAGGTVLIDERDLWPDKKFVITNLLVSTDFLTKHPDVVKQLIKGSVESNKYINANAADAQKAVSDGIQKLTGKPLDAKQLADAWKSITFLDDPLPSTLIEGAEHAQDVGLLAATDLNAIFDLTLLNEVLKESGQPEVKV